MPDFCNRAPETAYKFKKGRKSIHLIPADTDPSATDWRVTQQMPPVLPIPALRT
jgi:hypothetical protein